MGGLGSEFLMLARPSQLLLIARTINTVSLAYQTRRPCFVTLDLQYVHQQVTERRRGEACGRAGQWP